MAKNEATLLLRIKQVGGEIMDRFVITLGDVINAVKSVGGALVDSLRQFKEQEEAINSLNQSMVNSGIYTKDLSDKYIAQAEALSKITDFADEQIVSAQSILQAQLGTTEVTEELTKATLNLAAAKKMDLSSAAEMIAKSIGTETNALARQGIELDSTASKTEKMGMVIEQITAKWGGQAEAQVKGLGVFNLLSKATGELSEQMGSKLAPIFIVIGQSMLEFVTKYGPPLIEFFGTHLRQTIAEATAVFTGFGFVVESIGAALGTTFAYLFEVATAAISGNFSKIGSLTKTFTQSIADDQIKITEDANKKISDIAQAHADSETARREEDQRLQAESLLKKAELERAARIQSQIEKQEGLILEQQNELALIGANDDQKLAQQIKTLDAKLANETSAAEKLKLLKDKSALLDQQRSIKQKDYEDKINAQKLQGYSTFFGGVASLQASHSKSLASVGKAAAISQATIDAYLAIQRALATVPYPANFAAAAGIGIQAFANVSKIAGIPLAEGGIVRAQPGGIQATIGEGGRDEAVIPLDSPEAQGRLGGGTTINFYGPVLGDESQAMEFARAIDRSLLKLRQSNQSVAFETDIF